METPNIEYIESTDEDLHSMDEHDKEKPNTKNSLCNYNTLEMKNKLSNLHLQDLEQSNRCIREINQNKVREETRTDLVNENFKVNSLENNNSYSGNVKKNKTHDDMTLNVSYEENNVNIAKINNTKKELITETKENSEEQMSKNCKYLNKQLIYNKVTKSNIDFEDLWNEAEGWGVDDEKDKEKVNKNLWNKEIDSVIDQRKEDITRITDDAKNCSDVIGKNLWDNDEWEPIEKVKHDYVKTCFVKENNNSGMWARWSNWGISSVLSTANQSVSILTTTVSQGISTVLETSIGIRNPEELAKQKSDRYQNNIDKEIQNNNLLQFGFGNIGNLVSGVSKLVESTSTKVISGGLDTLETIGKKTMEVLQEGDPGLKMKREYFKLNREKPVLSQVLKEAKEMVGQESEILTEKHFAKKINYETLFDDHQGLVHLEALEMLSKQCEIKLQTLTVSFTGEASTEIQETIEQVKELCELPDEDENVQMSSEEIKERLKSAVEEISIHIKYDKLISTWEETELWLNNLKPGICDKGELYHQAIDTLARLTAIAIEQFHKIGELLYIKDHHSTADEADSLVQLTTVLTSLIGMVARKFSEKLNATTSESWNKDDINSLITNVFFEAANSSSFIQDAFQLLVPVLQIGSI